MFSKITDPSLPMPFVFLTVLHSVPSAASESKTIAIAFRHEWFDQVQACMGVKMKNKKIPILSLMTFFNSLEELKGAIILTNFLLKSQKSSYTEIYLFFIKDIHTCKPNIPLSFALATAFFLLLKSLFSQRFLWLSRALA